MHVVFVASEAAPWSKTGGLGDVAGALPRYLAARHAKVTLILPDYSEPAATRPPEAVVSAQAHVNVGGTAYPVTFRTLSLTPRLKVVWVGQELMFHRAFLYGDGARPYPDNLVRFLVFQLGVMAWIHSSRRRVDLVHANDWQTALLPLMLDRNPPRRGRPATVLTIHNLHYQGVFPGHFFALLDLPGEYFSPDNLEFFGNINCLKAGIIFSDAITTVSPTYAREILKPEYGAGLEGVLRRYQHKLRGILNGADYSVWDPRSDPHIYRTYGKQDALTGKRINRTALMQELGLDWPLHIPLGVAVTRLAHQKGADILTRALARLAPESMRAVILGTGDPGLEKGLRHLAAANPGICFIPRFSEPLAHRLQAAADLFLMPSRYEPCGLAQIYALRYGTIPVVRRTGGLADTITDADTAKEGTGFLFDRPHAAGLFRALKRAIRAVSEPSRLARLRATSMACDFSWDRAATNYAELYGRILSNGDQHE
ncbi:MAG TPA: glycogen synthase [Candidatus Aminicenantes bacterium]|nr:glycogen synthase [Candidatus Aminicenantes bacterium]